MTLANKANLCARLLDVIEQDILPKIRTGIASGNKAFGAAILNRDDCSLVVAEANREVDNPLFHGEISTLNAFYELPFAERPTTKDCLFVSTHESCPLCLSAITWCGFDNFYYLFDYQEIGSLFHIPHNLKIMQEVFNRPTGDYARENAYWQCHAIRELISNLSKDDASEFNYTIKYLTREFVQLADAYQRGSSTNQIPLS